MLYLSDRFIFYQKSLSMLQNSKLLTLLATLGPWQLKSFEKYVRSPFFNVNETVIKCLQEITLSYPSFDDVSETKLFNALFGRVNFEHKQLRYVMTDLTLLLEDFLAYETYQQDPFLRKQLLLKNFKDKGLEKYFHQQAVQAAEIIEKSKNNIDDYKRRMLLDEISFEFNRKQSGRSVDNSLQSLSDSMDQYYLAQRLKYICEMLNRKNVLSEQYDIPSLNYITAFLKGNPSENPLIAVYSQVLLLLQNFDNEAQYTELKKMVFSNLSKIAVEELREIFVFLQNFCIRMINSGKEVYLLELFHIYEEMITNEIIFENNELEHHHFKNIITLALRLDKVKWAEDFILSTQGHLNKEIRKNALSYNMARVFYAQKRYREALRLMRSVEFSDIFYHLDAKVLLIKIYYETEDFEPLLSLIASSGIYLRRSKLISDYQRGIYINFLNYVRKMARCKAGDNVDVKVLLSNIDQKKDIADISWLKSKLLALTNA
jgi:hypothetical protein